METICGLLALVYLGIVAWLGFTHAPIWIPAVVALIGCLLYLGLRPGVIRVFQRDGFTKAFLTI